MFLSTEACPQAHRVLGIVNATSHLMLPSEAIDSFESMDQLFSEVEEKLKQRAEAKGADGIVNIRFTTDVANVQVAPRFLVLTGYGTMVQLVDRDED
ncbi:MAG: heavy metal-binding domain-containing protein [Limosilactobacillus sp.]|uniref:heavy metal-binding domain-containing protein n=1 Tax=Limosilactobacillus sp. TaxID=2773925 RepID=UPI00270EF167|nr:heavy metal-binding domain-containing protein [Limosilactobacillus sp.]